MSRRSSTRQPEKDFIAFKGPMTLKITPRTARGRRAGMLWTLVLLLPAAPFMLLAMAVDDTPREHWALIAIVPLLIAEGLLIWAMTRWMLARAEVISVAEFKQWRDERESASRDRRNPS